MPVYQFRSDCVAPARRLVRTHKLSDAGCVSFSAHLVTQANSAYAHCFTLFSDGCFDAWVHGVVALGGVRELGRVTRTWHGLSTEEEERGGWINKRL